MTEATVELTLDLTLDLENGEILGASLSTSSIRAESGAHSDTEQIRALLDDRELVVDVCDTSNVLLVHRVIQHEQPEANGGS